MTSLEGFCLRCSELRLCSSGRASVVREWPWLAMFCRPDGHVSGTP